MRAVLCLPPVLAAVLASAVVHGARVTFGDDRFSVDVPLDWKRTKGPDDGNLLHYEAPGGDGSFAVYTLEVKKDHRADLEGTLKSRVESLGKAGLKVPAKIEGQEQDFDGKKALFAVVPVEAQAQGQTVKFSYYLVFLDAKDKVVIMQAALPIPLTEKLREATLAIIQSFREKQEQDE